MNDEAVEFLADARDRSIEEGFEFATTPAERAAVIEHADAEFRAAMRRLEEAR